MTHYLMIGGGSACGSKGPTAHARALVSCPECLAQVTRWSEAHTSAKTAWAERVERMAK